MKIPRIKFTGGDTARILNGIFAENLRDLRDKVEHEGKEFPVGFFHTSTRQHPGTCYYNQMWARDAGRGVIELSRLGFTDDAQKICRYFLSHITYGSHWARELHNPREIFSFETDGNALILLGIYNTWYMSGSDKALGVGYLDALKPIIEWCEKCVTGSKFSNLFLSRSEMSGNPETNYGVYGVFGNYGMYLALSALADMAKKCGHNNKLLSGLAKKVGAGLKKLISDGKFSKTAEGCFINGIDDRDMSAYDIMEFAGNKCDAWHWTRQLVSILNPDFKAADIFADVHKSTYDFVKSYMAKGELFRRYGFVSSTAWSGIGNRHDDYMCGYGQGFFTQAALLTDDVNTYGKCLEGIARLGYDGNVIEHLSEEHNPFVMHECFNYGNYEKALDHTFGVSIEKNDGKTINNPGDEGNLVQASEIIKALRLTAGIDYSGGVLIIAPRLPWLFDEIEVTDFPVIDKSGKPCRISFVYSNKRHLRKSDFRLIENTGDFDRIDVRFGPYPAYMKGLNYTKDYNVSWIIRELEGTELSVSLDEEQ